MSMFLKDPDEVLDYKFDWSTWLGSDTIQSITLIVPSGITKDSDTNDTTSATIWLSGGTSGNDYKITNRIVTAGGRTAERAITIRVSDK